MTSSKSLIFLIIAVFNGSFLLAQISSINLDSDSHPLTKISQIASEVVSITLTVSEENDLFISIDELILLDNSIVILAREDSKNTLPFKVLQFDKSGQLIRQLGKRYAGYISLIYDSSLKEVGINDNKTVEFHDEEGQFQRSIKSIANKMFFFESSYFGVKLVSGGKTWHYDLTRSDNQGENREIIWSYDNPPDLPIGLHPVYSFVKKKMFLSNQLDQNLYTYENGKIKLGYRLKSKNKLRDGVRLIDDWIIASTVNSRNSGQQLHYYNLKNDENFIASTIIKQDHITTTIKNDLGNSESLVPFHGSLLGQVENTIAFRDEKPGINGSSYTIHLVKLK